MRVIIRRWLKAKGKHITQDRREKRADVAHHLQDNGRRFHWYHWQHKLLLFIVPVQS